VYLYGRVSSPTNPLTRLGRLREETVFKEPTSALHQVETDCRTAISVIQKQYQLLSFSKFTIQEYGTYSWQVDSNDAEVPRQGHLLSAFYDLNENSFH